MEDLNTVFIQLLADFLNGDKTVINESVSWEDLIALAKKHQVEGIIAYQCKKQIPSEMVMKYQQVYAADLFYYSNRVKCASQIDHLLQEQKIPYFTVKGLNVAKLSPVPALRTMGDCDYIVQTEDRDRVHEIMLSLGFQNTQKNSMEWMYIKTEWSLKSMTGFCMRKFPTEKGNWPLQTGLGSL